ncbi:zinc finger and SCAN domain-containing protein 21-like [Centropristis striata]|uniref:zinc finger and SCAN domain-containing protein 21-like n=1 Tax=Centropristis striata TaxID=184440 RepID=UPI0027E05621|nr:zinc finger and SCAN domain-containing protein 21-like [Centropristis striata]
MSSAEYLRQFVNERLTAAAEEIFGVFAKSIIEYEEELDRQRRLLDIVLKPEINLHRIELPQQHVCKEEEGLSDQQQLCIQERSSSLDQEDPDPLQVKEEQEEPCTSQEGEQLVLKQETEIFMLTSTYEESDHSDDQTLDLSIGESQCVEEELKDSGSTAATEPNKRCHKSRSHSNNVDDADLSESLCYTQTGKKSFICDTCGKDCKFKSLLQRHMRTHTGEKPFLCKTCGKRFSDSSSFIRHVRIHTGEKPYSCTRCGKDFRLCQDLKVHMRTHTGEQPYPCKTCGRYFRNAYDLKVHSRTHTGGRPYVCITCEKDFKRKDELNSHMRTHTGKLSLCKDV